MLFILCIGLLSYYCALFCCSDGGLHADSGESKCVQRLAIWLSSMQSHRLHARYVLRSTTVDVSTHCYCYSQCARLIRRRLVSDDVCRYIAKQKLCIAAIALAMKDLRLCSVNVWNRSNP